jgi:hypothetical protein
MAPGATLIVHTDGSLTIVSTLSDPATHIRVAVPTEKRKKLTL